MSNTVISIHPSIINSSDLLSQLIDDYGDKATIPGHTFGQIILYQDDLINIINHRIIKYEPQFLEICSFLMINNFFSIINDDTRKYGNIDNANMVLSSKCGFFQIWYDSIFNSTDIYQQGIFFKDPQAELYLWVKYGHIDCIEWAREDHDITWDVYFTDIAALYGQLKCLKYLHNNGCPWDVFTCSSAAENGKLDCLKYLHSNGCPWSVVTCSAAAENGHIDCLKYAHRNGCPWNGTTCASAAQNGHIECLEYAQSNGCPE